MKRILIATVAITLLLGGFASAGPADNIFVGDIISFVRGPGTGQGGEFIVYKNNVPVYSTFCVQTAELLSLSPLANPMQYKFVVGDISSQIVLAGQKFLDPKSAYLYAQFREGTLPGYTGTNANANALQNAIWHAEGLATLATGDATTWYNMAVAANWQDIGYVRVINLRQYVAGVSDISLLPHAQDILVAPVPEPISMTLAGLGLATVMGLRRRSSRI